LLGHPRPKKEVLKNIDELDEPQLKNDKKDKTKDSLTNGKAESINAKDKKRTKKQV
jgi:hypothetical protein